MAKTGAKGKYGKWLTEEGLLLLAAWCRDGDTDEVLAKKMGIATGTLYDWKKKFPEISEALKKNKEIVDTEVENALLNNARGYSYVEEVPIKVREEVHKDGQKVVQERVEVVQVTKTKPAETTAALAWLNNRMPQKWRNKRDSWEQSDKQSDKIEIDPLSKALYELTGDADV